MKIAIDSETYLASNHEPIPKLVSIAIASGAGCELIAGHDPAVRRIVAEVYTAGAILANAPFDSFVFMRAFPELEELIVDAYANDRVFDVLTREKMIDTAEGNLHKIGGYNLGAVAKRRAGIEVDKADRWRKCYALLDGVEIKDWPEDAKSYAITDAAATWAVHEYQEGFAEEHRIPVFGLAGDIARRHLALYAQTLRGIHTDQAQVERVDRRMGAEIDGAAGELLSLGLARVEGTKTPKIVCTKKAAQDAMVQHCTIKGVRIPRTTKGAISISEDAINRAGVPKGTPLDVLRRFQAGRTLRSKTIPVLRHPLIRTRYDELKETGRTGSSAPQGFRCNVSKMDPWEWVGTNLQNQPTSGGFRECLVPASGNLFVGSDWGGAELVTLAQVQLDVLGRSILADVLREGRNPHTEFACRVMGISVGDYDPENPVHTSTRKVAKFWNFGKWGGMGDRKFRDLLLKKLEIDWSLSKVKEYTEIWKEQWGAKAYFNWVTSLPSYSKTLVNGQRIELYTVIHPRTGFVRGGCTYTEACNSPFQHLAAVAAGTALWWLWLEGRDPCSPLYRQYRPTSQVLFVHDENVSEVPAHLAPRARARQDEIMIEAFRQWCPDVPIDVDSNIMERYAK